MSDPNTTPEGNAPDQPQDAQPWQQPAADASVGGGAYGQQPASSDAAAQQPPASPYAQQPYGQQPASPCDTAAQGQPFASPYGQQPASPYGQQPYGQQPAPQAGKGKAIGALVCGILAIVFCAVPFVGIILGIVAIVLAVQFAKKNGKDGKATAGKVCGIVGIVFSVLLFAITLVLGLSIASYMAGSGLTSNDVVAAIEEATDESSKGSSGSGTATSDDEAAIRQAAEALLSSLKNMSEADLQELANGANEAFYEGSEYYMTDLGVDPVAFARWAMGDFDYKIESVAVDKAAGTAVIYVEVTTRDIVAFSEEFSNQISAYAESDEYANLTDEEQAKLKFGEIFNASMAKTTATTTNYIILDATRANGSWDISQDSWDEELTNLFGIF